MKIFKIKTPLLPAPVGRRIRGFRQYVWAVEIGGQRFYGAWDRQDLIKALQKNDFYTARKYD